MSKFVKITVMEDNMLIGDERKIVEHPIYIHRDSIARIVPRSEFDPKHINCVVFTSYERSGYPCKEPAEDIVLNINNE